MKKRITDRIKYNFTTEPKVEIISNEQVNIIGCKGITALDTDIIGAKMPRFTVMVYGEGLSLKEYRYDMVEITGRIANIEILQ